jgi:hypothetical protein
VTRTNESVHSIRGGRGSATNAQLPCIFLMSRPGDVDVNDCFNMTYVFNALDRLNRDIENYIAIYTASIF